MNFYRKHTMRFLFYFGLLPIVTTLNYLFLCYPAIANDVLIVMGASCSGKSTLSDRLTSSLGPKWKLVELDTIEDDLKQEHRKNGNPTVVSEQELQAKLIEEINKSLSLFNVVVDTNLYDKTIEHQIHGDGIYKILVHAPLNKLLERDERRTKNLRRNEQEAAEAKKFVVKTHQNFENQDPSFFDIKIDSSIQTLEKSLDELLSWYRVRKIPH